MKRALLLLLLAGGAHAQQVRVHTTTTVGLVQLRPIHFDSAGGQFVALQPQSAGPFAEDVEVSAWAFGVSGLRFYSLMRARASLGSELVWPRSSDHFDALAAYFELQRDDWRFRLGRQQHASGLGIYGFDGAEAAWQAKSSVRLEAWGGRGLERGTNDPLNSDAIRGLEPLIPDHGTLLVGLMGSLQPTATSSVTAVYQREVLDDLSGVLTERAALDALVQPTPRWTFTGQMDWDFVAAQVGRARLQARWLMPNGWSASAAAFRYRPVIDLSTIWGAFAPQGNQGATFGLEVPSGERLHFSAGYSFRRYEAATETTPFLVGVGDVSQELDVGARYTLPRFALEGTYRLNSGYGGEQSGGDLAATWSVSDSWGFALLATMFQQTDQFRVAKGSVIGAGGDVHVAVNDRLMLRGRAMNFANTGTSGGAAPDWSQLRATVQVDWTFGASADRTRSYP